MPFFPFLLWKRHGILLVLIVLSAALSALWAGVWQAVFENFQADRQDIALDGAFGHAEVVLLKQIILGEVESSAAERKGNLRIERLRHIALQQDVRRPSVRQDAAAADGDFIVAEEDLDGSAGCIVVVHEGIEACPAGPCADLLAVFVLSVPVPPVIHAHQVPCDGEDGSCQRGVFQQRNVLSGLDEGDAEAWEDAAGVAVEEQDGSAPEPAFVQQHEVLKNLFVAEEDNLPVLGVEGVYQIAEDFKGAVA